EKEGPSRKLEGRTRRKGRSPKEERKEGRTSKKGRNLKEERKEGTSRKEGRKEERKDLKELISND
ncbi:hypothetical protein ADUPG1_011636, partial [Aduncisulcus paluster]